MSYTTTTATLAALKGLRAKAAATLRDACARAAAATAIPAGKRGRKAEMIRTCAEVNAANHHLGDINADISEAAKPAVEAWARGHLHGVEDDLLLQVINAPRINVALRTEVGDVFASISTNDLGLPTYVEIRELAKRDEVIETATKWRDTAKDDETRAAAEAILAAPDGFAMYAKASAVGSITVGVHHRWRLDTEDDKVIRYYLNASTSQAYTDHDVDVALRLVLVARLLREKLNALDLPNDIATRARYDAAIA